MHYWITDLICRFVSDAALRGFWEQKVTGAHAGRLVPEDYWDRWVLWDPLELGLQVLQALRAMWESLDSEEILVNQVRVFKLLRVNPTFNKLLRVAGQY